MPSFSNIQVPIKFFKKSRKAGEQNLPLFLWAEVTRIGEKIDSARRLKNKKITENQGRSGKIILFFNLYLINDFAVLQVNDGGRIVSGINDNRVSFGNHGIYVYTPADSSFPL